MCPCDPWNRCSRLVSTTDRFHIQIKTNFIHSPEVSPDEKLRECTTVECVCVCVWLGPACVLPCVCMGVKQGHLSCVSFNSWTKHIWCNTCDAKGNHNMELLEFRYPGAIMMANSISVVGWGAEKEAVVIVTSHCASPRETHFANPSTGDPTQNHQPSISGSTQHEEEEAGVEK